MDSSSSTSLSTLPKRKREVDAADAAYWLSRPRNKPAPTPADNAKRAPVYHGAESPNEKTRPKEDRHKAITNDIFADAVVAQLDADQYSVALDSAHLFTVQHLLGHGVPANRIIVVESNAAVHALICAAVAALPGAAERNGLVTVKYGVLHEVLRALKCDGVHVGAVYADLMCASLSNKDARALADTRPRVLCLTLCQRPGGKRTIMERRIDEVRHGPLAARFPGLRWIYGYTQQPKGAPMCFLEMSRDPNEKTRMRPRKIRERRGDLCKVQWFCFPEPKQWSWAQANDVLPMLEADAKAKDDENDKTTDGDEDEESKANDDEDEDAKANNDEDDGNDDEDEEAKANDDDDE